jgi:hypothetical protein
MARPCTMRPAMAAIRIPSEIQSPDLTATTIGVNSGGRSFAGNRLASRSLRHKLGNRQSRSTCRMAAAFGDSAWASCRVPRKSGSSRCRHTNYIRQTYSLPLLTHISVGPRWAATLRLSVLPPDVQGEFDGFPKRQRAPTLALNWELTLILASRGSARKFRRAAGDATISPWKTNMPLASTTAPTACGR